MRPDIKTCNDIEIIRAECLRLQRSIETLMHELKHLPMQVRGFTVSNCSDVVALFVLGERGANKVAELLKLVSKKPEWVHIREASFVKTEHHDGWYQDVVMPDTIEILDNLIIEV